MCLFLCLEKAVSHSCCLRGVADELVEEIDLLRGERQFWRGFGDGSVEHSDPEDPPAEQAQDREQVDDSFGSPESRLFGLAARLQYLVEGLDLRRPYQRSFSMASSRLRTVRSVISFQSILSRSLGSVGSVAWMMVSSSAGYSFCLATGGRTLIRR